MEISIQEKKYQNDSHTNSIKMVETRRRDYYFQLLKRTSEYLPYEDWSSFTVELVNVRLEQLETTWTRLEALHLELLERNDLSAADENYMILDEAQRMYANCKATLLRKVLELQRTVPAAVASIAPATPSPSENQSEKTVDFHELEMDLLKEIGKFNGDFAEWCEFRNQFMAKVHADTTLRNARKLKLLMMAVTDRAARVLGKWQLTDANYGMAWHKLCTVYNNQYQIARAHIQSLHTMPRLTSATFDGIFELIDKVMYAQTQLSTMGVPVDKWDLMIIYLVEERLDDRSRDAWIDYRENKKIILPKWDEMLEFLRRRAVTLSSPTHLLSTHFSDEEAFTPIVSKRTQRQRITNQFEVKGERDGMVSIPKRNLFDTSVATSVTKKKERKQTPLKPLPMIERPKHRHRHRKNVGTGENRMNVGKCIVCNATKNVRFVNCKQCTDRGHLTCLREFMDAVNHESNWKCPKCLKHANLCNIKNESEFRTSEQRVAN